MVKLRDEKVYLFTDTIVPIQDMECNTCMLEPGADYSERTMAYSILTAHNTSGTPSRHHLLHYRKARTEGKLLPLKKVIMWGTEEAARNDPV